MTKSSIVDSVIWNDFFKIAWVNLITGEYEFVKNLETSEEKPCLEADTIYDYSERIASSGLIHPEDLDAYKHFTAKEYILREVMTNRKRITVNFRHNMPGRKKRWIRLEIVLPQDFSENNPWAAYTWKESDEQICTVEDAMRMLSQCFHKILRVNLTQDTFEVIKAYSNDLTADSGFSDRFSEWLRNIAAIGKVYGEDIKSFNEFVNSERLKKRFCDSRDCLRFRYRRLYGNEYRWVYMEFLPSVEYTDENQIVIMYVRDIHDDYVSELHRQKALEYYCNYDTLTGLRSRFCYNSFCRSFEQQGGALAVLFADVNGLKYTNDTKGHESGDRLITGFAELLSSEFGVEYCYRISGDEFVVLIDNADREDFLSRAEKLHQELLQMEIPMASVGAAWDGSAGSVDALIRIAETRMYEDKQEFYKKYPEMKR